MRFADLYPAVITAEGETYGRARLYFVDGRAIIFEMTDGEMQPKADRSGGTLTRLAGKRFTVTFDDGTQWDAMRSGGCGCGDSAKRFRPAQWIKDHPVVNA